MIAPLTVYRQPLVTGQHHWLVASLHNDSVIAQTVSTPAIVFYGIFYCVFVNNQKCSLVGVRS